MTYWEEVKTILQNVPEEGAVTRQEVETWAWWHHKMVNEMEQAGFYYRGKSVKYQGWSTLMVVKVAREDTPLVVFITERTTTDCMRVFRRLWDEGRVDWRNDKFA